MSTWSAIDGNAYDEWEYVSLEIISDAVGALTALDEGWPRNRGGETAWARLLSAQRAETRRLKVVPALEEPATPVMQPVVSPA